MCICDKGTKMDKLKQTHLGRESFVTALFVQKIKSLYNPDTILYGIYVPSDKIYYKAFKIFNYKRWNATQSRVCTLLLDKHGCIRSLSCEAFVLDTNFIVSRAKQG